MADKADTAKEAILMREAFRSALGILNRLECNVQKAYNELVEYKGAGEHAAAILDKHTACAGWEDFEEEE